MYKIEYNLYWLKIEKLINAHCYGIFQDLDGMLW